MADLRKYAAQIGFGALALATVFGFRQAAVDRESACESGNKAKHAIELVFDGLVAQSKAQRPNETAEEYATRKAQTDQAVKLYKKGLAPTDCSSGLFPGL